MKFEKLGNIASIQIGKTPKRDNASWWGKGNLWVSISDLKEKIITKTKEEITELAIKECGCKRIPKGTLLMSFKLSIGKVAFAGSDLYTNEAICGLAIKDKDKIFPEYLYYVLKHTKFQGSNVAVKGATLNTASLKEIKIPIIPLEDQIRIATLLSKAEALIKQRKESIDLLDEYLKSTFLEMFGDPVSNERNWNKGPVGKYTDCIVPGRDKPKSFTGTTPWFTTADLIHKGFVIKSKNNLGLSDFEINEVKAKRIPVGSVIMTCVGDLGVLSINKEVCIVNQQLHAFLCKSEINNVFLMFNLSFMTSYMYKMASTTTVPYMNKTICNSIPVILPDINLQTKFANIVEKTEKLKIQYKSSLAELENLYDSLSQKAFKGELNLEKGEEMLMAAEPVVGYGKTYSLAQAAMLAGYLIIKNRNHDFGRVKLMKLVFLLEYHLKLIIEKDISYQFFQKTAGPYNEKYIKALESCLYKYHFFVAKKERTLNHRDHIVYESMNNDLHLIQLVQENFTDRFDEVESLTNLLKRQSWQTCEIIATLYAVWNNRLKRSETISDSELLKDFYDWSDHKQEYPEMQVMASLDFMRSKNIIPTGFGKYIEKENAKGIAYL